MSYLEAKADDIRMEKDSRGFNSYLPPCAVCRTPVRSWSYIRGTRYLCRTCRLAERREKLISGKSVHVSAW